MLAGVVRAIAATVAIVMVMIVVMSVGIVMMNMMVDITRSNTLIGVFREQFFGNSHRRIRSFIEAGPHQSCALPTITRGETLLVVESVALQA